MKQQPTPFYSILRTLMDRDNLSYRESQKLIQIALQEYHDFPDTAARISETAHIRNILRDHFDLPDTHIHDFLDLIESTPPTP